MGHERLGTLPRSKRWRTVVAGMSAFPAGGTDAADIARKVIDNVQDRVRRLSHDGGVLSSFQFLVALAVASRSPNPNVERPWEIRLPEQPTPLALSLALRSWVHLHGSGEYTALATQAATDALVQWRTRRDADQADLFRTTPDPYEKWRGIGEGRGFSELAHLYFSNFTRRYLNYFLEREASAVIATIEYREQFDAAVAQHASETAKITQSFAAGWFNKYASAELPSVSEVDGFLGYSLQKIREELLRERDKR